MAPTELLLLLLALSGAGCSIPSHAELTRGRGAQDRTDGGEEQDAEAAGDATRGDDAGHDADASDEPFDGGAGSVAPDSGLPPDDAGDDAKTPASSDGGVQNPCQLTSPLVLSFEEPATLDSSFCWWDEIGTPPGELSLQQQPGGSRVLRSSLADGVPQIARGSVQIWRDTPDVVDPEFPGFVEISFDLNLQVDLAFGSDKRVEWFKLQQTLGDETEYPGIALVQDNTGPGLWLDNTGVAGVGDGQPTSDGYDLSAAPVGPVRVTVHVDYGPAGGVTVRFGDTRVLQLSGGRVETRRATRLYALFGLKSSSTPGSSATYDNIQITFGPRGSAP